MRESEARFIKTSSLKRFRTRANKALAACRERLEKTPDNPGLCRIMIEPLEYDLQVIEAELKQRAAPAVTNGERS